MLKYSERKYIFYSLFVIIGFIFLIKLFYIQVIDKTYKLSAKNNVLRYITDYPARGNIYDRNGRLLVYNEAAYDLMVIPRQVKNIDTADLCNILGINKEQYILRINKAKNYSVYKPSLFEKQLSADIYAILQEKLYKFSGFFIQPRTLRKYPYKVAAHVLGYIGEVSEQTIQKDKYYRQGDYIGISGIERSYERYLRGKRGTRIVLVDVFNREKGSFKNGLYDTIAVSGKDIVTTLDIELQNYGERLMQNKKGSIVAIEPSTGEILALVTSPAYDPNLLTGRERTQNFILISSDTLEPLFNRALMAKYPIGSVFKIINALIGLQEGVIKTNTCFSCTGGYSFGTLFVGCHNHPSPLNLIQSIQYSCNTYYCNVFRRIIDNPKYKSTKEGYINWRKYVESFNLGKKLNSDLTTELAGFIPKVEYYDRFYGGNGWNSLTIISLGIGQGEIGITPLQLANIAAIIANRGSYYVPHIVKKIGGQPISDYLTASLNPTKEGTLYSSSLPIAEVGEWSFTTKHYTNIDPIYYDVIIEGMYLTVESGTGYSARLSNIAICGKTGTVQNPHGKDHSVFIAFAPKQDPKIAISVVVENAGFGATWAAPIASLMIEKYLSEHITRPAVEEKMLNCNLISNKKPIP